MPEAFGIILLAATVFFIIWLLVFMIISQWRP